MAEPGFAIVSSKQSSELLVQEVVYSAGWVMPPHVHASSAVVFTLSGRYEEDYSGVTLSCRRGTAKLRPADHHHVTRIGAAGAHCVSVEVPTNWLARYQLERRFGALPPGTFSGQSVANVFHELRAELLANDEGARLSIEGLVLFLAASLSRGERKRATKVAPRWLAEINEHLQGETSKPAALSQLASWAGVHPVHLAAEFRRYYGMSVGEFGRSHRIRRAMDLLVRSRASLSEIALITGFSSQGHFTTTFKRLVGEPPGRYRATRVSPAGAVPQHPAA